RWAHPAPARGHRLAAVGAGHPRARAGGHHRLRRHHRLDGGASLDAVGAHLPSPRAGRSPARQPGGTGRDVRGGRRPAALRAPGDDRPQPGRVPPRPRPRSAHGLGPAGVGGHRPHRRPGGGEAPQPRLRGRGARRCRRAGRVPGPRMAGAVDRLARTGAQGGGMAEPTIEAYYLEERTFPPPEEFRRNALVSDAKLYEQAEADFEGFWATQARELVSWFQDFDTVLEWNLPFAKWFVGGR